MVELLGWTGVLFALALVCYTGAIIANQMATFNIFEGWIAALFGFGLCFNLAGLVVRGLTLEWQFSSQAVFGIIACTLMAAHFGWCLKAYLGFAKQLAIFRDYAIVVWAIWLLWFSRSISETFLQSLAIYAVIGIGAICVYRYLLEARSGRR